MGWYAELGVDQFIYDSHFSGKRDGVMIEVGAGPPEYLSMSKGFRERGWRTICIDPNPFYANLHRKEGNEIYECAISDHDEDDSSFFVHNFNSNNEQDAMSYSSLGMRYKGEHNLSEIKINVRTLNCLLQKILVEKIDLISIDTEGWELEVLKGFDLKKYQPEVIMVENLHNEKEVSDFLQNFRYRNCKKSAVNTIYEKIRYGI